MTDTLTAQELHRLVTAPWCPKCGLCATMGPSTLHATEDCLEFAKPGLWHRAEQTRVEGLEWERSQRGDYWGYGSFGAPPEMVELLILGRLVKVLPPARIMLWAAMIRESRNKKDRLTLLVEETHRWLDSQEQATVEATIEYAQKRYGDVLERLADGPDSQEHP